MTLERYAVLAVQTANPIAREPADIAANLKRTERLLRRGLAAHRPFGAPIKLVVLPEFAFQGVPYLSVAEINAHAVAVELPGPIDAALKVIAAEHDCTIVAGTVIERDPAYPDHLFNTAAVVGPSGLIAKYRKLNPWLPLEPFSSPADVAGLAEQDPIVCLDLPCGRLGVTTCYDNYFPELWRELALRGAEVIASPAALMHPLQDAGPDDPWRALCRVRCLENGVYGVFANQGASAAAFPPFGWRGGSYAIDPKGIVLAANESPGEGFAYAEIDLAALRARRVGTLANHFASQVRTKPYPYLRRESVLDRTAAVPGANDAARADLAERARDALYRRERS